jgi:hypothetical protein
MLAGPHLDLAAGAEKMEMHRPSVLSASDPEINSEVNEPVFANYDGSDEKKLITPDKE